MPLRIAILDHMISIAHLLLDAHVQHSSIQAYIQESKMNMNGTWGTDIEILTFASLCQANVYVYGTRSGNWVIHPPSLSVNDIDVSIESVYLLHSGDHYDVVSSVTKT